MATLYFSLQRAVSMMMPCITRRPTVATIGQVRSFRSTRIAHIVCFLLRTTLVSTTHTAVSAVNRSALFLNKKISKKRKTHIRASFFFHFCRSKLSIRAENRYFKLYGILRKIDVHIRRLKNERNGFLFQIETIVVHNGVAILCL